MTTTRTHLTFRIDLWTPDSEGILAGTCAWCRTSSLVASCDSKKRRRQRAESWRFAQQCRTASDAPIEIEEHRRGNGRCRPRPLWPRPAVVRTIPTESCVLCEIHHRARC